MNAQLENERDTETYCRLAGLTDSMPATLIAEMVSDRGRPIASFRAKVLGSPNGQSESPNVSVSEIMISQIHGLIIFISLSKEQFWGYIPFSDKLLDPSMKLFQSFHFVSKHLAVSSEANEILDGPDSGAGDGAACGCRNGRRGPAGTASDHGHDAGTSCLGAASRALALLALNCSSVLWRLSLGIHGQR